MTKAQWIPVDVMLPPKGKLVLARGSSGYVNHTEFFTAAYYDAEYRPRSPWLSVQNDRLSDQGWEPTHWRTLDDLIPLEEPVEKPKGPPNRKVVEGKQPPKDRKDIWNFDD